MGRTAKHEFEAEEVMAYLDGELAPARAVELAGHLEHCEECAVLAKQFRQLSERLLDLGVEQTPERVGPIVLARLESGELQHGAKPSREFDEWIGAKLRRAFRKPLLWGLAAATIVAVVLVTAYHGSNRGGIASSTRSLSSYSVDSYLPTDRVSPKTSTAPAYIPKLAPSAKSEQLSSDSEGDGTDGGTAGKLESPAPAGPMVAQSVSLTIVANNYADASEAIDRLAATTRRIRADVKLRGPVRRRSATFRDSAIAGRAASRFPGGTAQAGARGAGDARE